MPKIPYNFKAEFQDDAGKTSKMVILDWEFLQLYLTYTNKYKDGKKFTQDEAKNKVLVQLELFRNTKDLYFFLGTTYQFDKWASNPFIIIGIFYPKKTSFYNQPLFNDLKIY